MCVRACVCVCLLQQSYDILLLILMLLLLVQAVLTLATVVHCAAYKSQLRMGAPVWEERLHLSPSRLSKVPAMKYLDQTA